MAPKPEMHRKVWGNHASALLWALQRGSCYQQLQLRKRQEMRLQVTCHTSEGVV